MPEDCPYADPVNYDPDEDALFSDDEEDCPTCNGTGVVNPLTRGLPADFLCLTATTCPYCDGSGIDML